MILYHMILLVIPGLFVHAIRENINGLALYQTRRKAECDTNPNHRYFSYCMRTNRGVTNLSLSRHEFSQQKLEKSLKRGNASEIDLLYAFIYIATKFIFVLFKT